MRPSARAALRRVLLLLIGGLYVLSIPWYRSPGSARELVLGLPDWVAVALACYVAVALLNAAAWLLCDVPDEREDAERPPEEGP